MKHSGAAFGDSVLAVFVAGAAFSDSVLAVFVAGTIFGNVGMEGIKPRVWRNANRNVEINVMLWFSAQGLGENANRNVEVARKKIVLFFFQRELTL